MIYGGGRASSCEAKICSRTGWGILSASPARSTGSSEIRVPILSQIKNRAKMALITFASDDDAITDETHIGYSIICIYTHIISMEGHVIEGLMTPLMEHAKHLYNLL